jgi:hypothetical protein
MPVAIRQCWTYLKVMPRKPKIEIPLTLTAEWPLPAAATIGSSVRARGILLEIRARLPATTIKWLDVVSAALVLKMPEGAETEFDHASRIIEKSLVGIEQLPVIPREIEDILTIKTSERHRWLKDGRLPSAGTRTVKLRGRAKKITFHVFDPRKVEEILNDDLVSTWREDDALTAAENRRRAAWNRKLARAEKTPSTGNVHVDGDADEPKPNLRGWEEFERDGLLR